MKPYVFVLSALVVCACAKPRYTQSYRGTTASEPAGRTGYVLPEVIPETAGLPGMEAVVTAVRGADAITTLSSLMPSSFTAMRQPTPLIVRSAAPNNWKRVASPGEIELFVDVENVRKLADAAGVKTVLIPVVHVRARSGSYFRGTMYCPMQTWMEARTRFVMVSGSGETSLDVDRPPNRNDGFFSRMFNPVQYNAPPRFYELHTLEVLGLRCRMAPRPVLSGSAILDTASKEFLRSIK